MKLKHILDNPQFSRVAIPTLNYSRMALYMIESWPVRAARRALGVGQPFDPPKQSQKVLLAEIRKMVSEDTQNIKNGIYPPSLLLPEDPYLHLKRYAALLKDSVKAAFRIKQNKTKSFSSKSKKLLKDLPDYYARNFHFQTDGYLSEDSAELYAHQTEILFFGTIALMRRLLMAPLLKHLQGKSNLQVLELGSGAGEATEILLRSVKDVDITCVDLSKPYIQFAKNKLANFKNLNFIHGDATNLNLKQKFDVVFSAYCLHEMPKAVRVKLINSANKHLKPGGFLILMDSLQQHDRIEFDWALKQFPKDFHEPFYTDYIKTPLKSLLGKKFSLISEEHRFLSKMIMAQKIK